MILKTILATDCGSTTTKAILIEFVKDEYRLTYRGEAPTTVEAPFEDVTRGVLNAVMEIEELSGRKIIDDDKISDYEKSIISGHYVLSTPEVKEILEIATKQSKTKNFINEEIKKDIKKSIKRYLYYFKLTKKK